MNPHYFLSLTVRVPALLKYLSEVKSHHIAYADEGVLIKTAFAETFGEGNWPKPFAVRKRNANGDYEVLAYSERSPEDLASIYHPVPRLAAALPADMINGYALAMPKSGTELRFHIVLCPMVRTYSDPKRGIRGRERDVFTIETEKAQQEGRDPRDRMLMYKDFLTTRMHGADILSCQPMGFDLVKVNRGKKDTARRFAIPGVTFSGMLKITDPETFVGTVAKGIGRQKTYGFGMILLGASAPR